MKTILYATDCTQRTSPGLKYAYNMSRALNAQLHVIHVYDLLPIVTTSVRARGILEANFAEEQEQLLKMYCHNVLRKEFGSPKLHYHVVKHEVIATAISNTAKNIEAELVIAGVKDRKSLRGVFTGNIANALMTKLICPVLILPENVVYTGFSTIIYATDFDVSDLHAIEHLVELAMPFGAQIEIIHIPRKKEQYHDRKMAWFKAMLQLRVNYKYIFFSSKQAEDVETGIHQFIEKSQPEILVMLERQRETFIEKLIHKDLVKTMSDEISIPLLVFNKKSIRLDFTTEEADEPHMMALV